MKVPGRWWREPIVHFALLGFLVVAGHRWLYPPAPGRVIEIDSRVVERLRQEHLRRTGALPVASEEQTLLERYIEEEEALYREALALGLDRGDVIARRRLVQKMEFLLEDIDPPPRASDDELRRYLEAHRGRYAEPPRVTLEHVFVRGERGGDARARAAALLEQLRAGADPAAIGDPFLRGREFRDRSQRELEGIFGPSFAAAVLSVPEGQWFGPIASSYGWHLVRVSARAGGQVPELSEVRARVARDWEEEQRQERRRRAAERVRRRYRLRVAASAARTAPWLVTARAPERGGER